MMLALHGEAGGWDELLIAAGAFGVLWLAVKLAGRKSTDDADDTSTEGAAAAADAPEDTDPAQPRTPGRR